MILRPCSKTDNYGDSDPVIVERWNGNGWSEVEVTRAFYNATMKEFYKGKKTPLPEDEVSI